MGNEELRGFAHVYLEDSFVESVRVTLGSVRFVAEVVLLPGHERYHPPLPAELRCYERSVISFFSVTSVTWSGQGAKPAIDAAGELDYGGFDRLERVRTGWLVDGDWGSMAIDTNAPPSIAPAKA